MTDLSGQQPQRIGDAERDTAVDLLRDHLAAGRLDQSEFDERLTRALTARTQSDLDPLFTDLPGPRPADGVVPTSTFSAPPWQANTSQQVVPRPSAPVPAPSAFNSAWTTAAALAWPAAIIFCFATEWHFWWVMLIPLFFPWWLNKGHHDGHHNRHRRR